MRMTDDDYTRLFWAEVLRLVQQEAQQQPEEKTTEQLEQPREDKA